jgi:hypothetical protein
MTSLTPKFQIFIGITAGVLETLTPFSRTYILKGKKERRKDIGK